MITKIVCGGDVGLILLESGFMEWFRLPGDVSTKRLEFVEASDISLWSGWFLYKQGKQWFDYAGGLHKVKYPNRIGTGEVYHRYPDSMYSGTRIDRSGNLFEHKANHKEFWTFKRPPFNVKAFVQYNNHTCYVLDYDGQMGCLPYDEVYARTKQWQRCVECIPKLKQLNVCAGIPCGVTLDGLLWVEAPQLKVPEYLQWKGQAQ